ncbi:CAP domain-containing protein [Jannaschia sp. S6380]|uniref:CAP domain-containing protein n=1 Tax=Jannaschia sp. S6380 TaxID=2926408 RepID=UPI001FF2E87F|nr:CAP domain-containing protein [Jannaschia sp. S6380]MCK0167797.1 CAP domain-containing protein [Jannaschia sp. S6380]
MILRAIALAILVAAPVSAGEVPEALRLASEARKQNGLPGLRHDRRLAAAAEVQARHMASTGKMGHKGPRGSRLQDRLEATGYRACAGAENVAMGQQTAQRVTVGWMGSRGHRRNILNRDVTHGAVAAVRDARGTVWWAMVLGRHC